MVNVTIYRNQDSLYTGFDCKGHAGFANAGSDIVCAGVSALVINTINSIGCFTKEAFDVETEEDSGLIRFRLSSPSGHDSYLLLQSLVLGLQGIQNQYGNEYIDLDYQEV